MAPEAVAAAAERVLEDTRVETVVPVAQAVTDALHDAAADDIVVIAGSLYVVGEARTRLGG